MTRISFEGLKRLSSFDQSRSRNLSQSRASVVRQVGKPASDLRVAGASSYGLDMNGGSKE